MEVEGREEEMEVLGWIPLLPCPEWLIERGGPCIWEAERLGLM